MTLVLSAEVAVDASKGVAGLKQAAAALSDAKVKVLETSSAAKVASAALAELEKQNRKSGAATAAMAEEERRLREALAQASLEATAAQRAFQQLDIAQTKLSQSGGRGVQSAGQQRAAYQQLGFQISDVAAQASVGTSAFVIFAQQGGQVAQALAGTTGAVGRMASFLAGPWGAAALGAISILGVLASKSGEAGSASLLLANRFGEAGALIDRTFTAPLIRAGRSISESFQADMKQLADGAVSDLARAAQAIQEFRKFIGLQPSAAVDDVFKPDPRRNSFQRLRNGVESYESQRRAEARLAAQQAQLAEASKAARTAATEMSRAAAAAAKEAAKAQAEHNKQVESLLQMARRAGSVDFFANPGLLDGPTSQVESFEKRRQQARTSDELSDMVRAAEERLPQIGENAGENFGASASDALFRRAEEIGNAIGGRAGSAVTQALLGFQTGDFRGVGGRAGSGLQAASDIYSRSPELQSAGKDVVKKLGEVFGDQPFFKNFATTVGPYLQAAGQGAGIGGAVGGGSTASQIGGAIGSVAGKALGTAIAGPLGGAIGSLAGSILGGLVGGALVKPKTGSVTLSGSGGEVVTGAATGTGASQRANATSLGGSVGSTLNQIIERLGAEVGKFSVSIGQEGGRFRVDTSGQGRTNKKKSGVLAFGEDEGAAVQAALADAIRDGAVAGVSPRVDAALKKYATDVNKAVAEALKVQGLEELLANRENPFSSVFQDFERQAKDRLKIAKAYGFDVLEIEKVNAEERAKLLREQLTDATSSVKALLDDLKFGNRAEGSVNQRLAGLSAERGRLEGLVAGGDASQIDALAQVIQQQLDLSKQAFGSTAQFAGARNDAISSLEALVRQTEARIAQASTSAQQPTVDKLTELNTTADEQTALQQQILAAVQSLGLSGGGGAGTVLSGFARAAV